MGWMGDTIKLRETPAEVQLPPGHRKIVHGTPGKLGGHGKNVVHKDNPQPSPNVVTTTMDAVQRLNGSGRTD